MSSAVSSATAAGTIPAESFAFLRRPELVPVWAATRARLERTGLTISSSYVSVRLDHEGRTLLSSLTGGHVTAGSSGATRVRLDVLDTALRQSAANCGLLGVLTALDGPVTDRQAARAARTRRSSDLWGHVEEQLITAGLSGAAWAAEWTAEVRRSGILTRAGDAAATAVTEACAVLAALAEQLPLTGPTAQLEALLPAAPRFELAELASRCTSSAHGLDAGTTTGALVVRALAVATSQPAPATAAARRLLWDGFGVAPDHVSGTILLWAVRPPGDSPWARMMAARADLGLVTHVTMQEWRQAAAAQPWAQAGQVVHVCENPQVLQAVARARLTAPLLCLSGNPATVGLTVLDALIDAGVTVTYHGDFDVDDVKIAQRIIGRGAGPWRMNASDYQEARTVADRTHQLPLIGHVAPTSWDADLAADMNRAQVAIHEEALLALLLADLG